jgi:hypothetical protein
VVIVKPLAAAQAAIDADAHATREQQRDPQPTAGNGLIHRDFTENTEHARNAP